MSWHSALRTGSFVILGLCSLAIGGQAVAQSRVMVINMIPPVLSNEVGHDSEPNLAVNPINPAQMAASAFTSGAGYCAATYAPLFITSDGGNSWQLRCTLPTEHPQQKTYDVTLAFGSSGEALYAATIPKVDPAFLIWGPFPYMDVLRTTDYDSPSPMTSVTEMGCRDVETRGPCYMADQPYVDSECRW